MKLLSIIGLLSLSLAYGQYDDGYDGGVLLMNPPARPIYNRLFYWNPWQGPNPTVGYAVKPTPRLV